MSILERVQSVAENLTRAEHLLVREIIAKPRDVALGTASSLAQRTGVHEATASRLAKNWDLRATQDSAMPFVRNSSSRQIRPRACATPWQPLEMATFSAS